MGINTLAIYFGMCLTVWEEKCWGAVVCKLRVFISGDESELEVDDTNEFGRLFRTLLLLRDDVMDAELVAIDRPDIESKLDTATEFRNRLFTSKRDENG